MPFQPCDVQTFGGGDNNAQLLPFCSHEMMKRKKKALLRLTYLWAVSRMTKEDGDFRQRCEHTNGFTHASGDGEESFHICNTAYVFFNSSAIVQPTY